VAYKPLNPVVAEVSPNLYKAAVTANLPPEQQKIIEQMSFTHKKAKDLLKLSEEQARKQFLELDPIVQSNMRYLFPDKKTFEAEQGLLGKATQAVSGAVTNVFKGISSPLLVGFAAGDIWGKVVNTAPTIYRQVKQKIPFSKEVIKDGFNGKNSFKWDRVDEFEQKYGKGIVSLVTSTIDGKTPGEAIDEYGKVDAEILDAIKFYNDEPQKFNKILEEVKMNAQISPGRDVAGRAIQDRVNNKIDTVPERLLKNLGIDMSTEEGILKAQKVVSGPIDGLYQIGIDPFSWAGVGTALKAVTKGIEGVKATPTEALRFVGLKSRGEKIKDKYQFLAERGDVTAGMDFVFRQPDVIKLWDEELGPIVRNFANAKTSQEKASVYRTAKTQYPEWANTEILTGLAIGKAFDANSARKFFVDIDDKNLLMQGNLDGVSFYRNAIPVSKSYRNLTSSVHQTADAIFNPSVKTGEIAKNVDSIRLGSAMDILTKVSNERDVLINPAMADLIKLEKDVNVLHKAGRVLQRSPGRILYGEDAIKTVDEVRDLAAQVVRRDLADTIAFEFLNQSEEYQRTIVRNLSYGYMLKQGMVGVPDGKNQMSEILNATFNEKAGMYSTVRSEVPQHFVGRVSREAYTLENDVAVQSSKGIVQLSQTAEGTAPLPYEIIAENAAIAKFKGKDKLKFMTLLGGITRNKFTRAYSNFWSTFTLFPRLGTRTSIDESFFYFLTAPTDELIKFAFGGRKEVKALSAISGSKSAIGYKRAIYKLFPKMDITQKIPFDKRVELVEELAAKLKITPEQVQQEMIRTELVNRYEEIVGTQLPPGALDNMRKLLKNNPSAVDSIANSMGAKTSLSARVDKEFVNAQFTPSNLTKMYEANNLKASKKYRAVDINELNDLEIAVAHFDNFSIRFSYNGKTVGEQQYVSPVTPFFRHNALKTGGDFELARRDILDQVGVRADLDLNTFDAFNLKKVKDFNKEFSTTVYYRQQGMSEADIARVHIDNMLIDMYDTFHGGPSSYNQKLYDAIVERHQGLYGSLASSKSISGGNAGKGTPLGDAKDIAMRSESNAAIVELADLDAQKKITTVVPNGVGKTSSETSLLRLGPATGDLSGKTIMLARNGKLANKELRPETIKSIVDANAAGAKFVVGDMPNVDSQFHDLLNKIDAKYTIFHTGTEPRTGVVQKPKKMVKAAWAKASASLTPEEFISLTKGFRPASGQINTRLVFMGGEADLKGLEDVNGNGEILGKFQNWAMDIMDAQVNGLYRQPAVWITYSKYMDDLAPYEKKLATQYKNAIKQDNPLISDAKAAKLANAQAEKQRVELAWNGAVNELITFADNPNIKTNFAVSVRSVGRFYRATEDFYRRVYRLYTKKPLQTLYRLRLLHTGLQASGDIYEDDKGDIYVTFPTDIIINSAVNPIIKVFGGDFKVPSFNDFAIKLRLINPSFAPDAGQPAFSGPVSAVGLLTLKAFLRELPLIPGPIKDKIDAPASKAADAINTIALGNIGKNLDLREAVMPLLGSTIWTSLSPTESDRQKSTAVLQAISYFQAYGYNLPADATVEETDKYLSNLKIATNSVVVGRNFLGQISPAYPALRDTKGLPAYMKDVGITSFKAEFWDIYNSILRNDSENATDAFELALATFIGKNPGKLAYIVPRNNSAMKVFINKTEEVKNWAVTNSNFIDTYGETAYIFAPRVGEYNPDVYSWMESEGILRFPKGKDEFNKYLKNYLKDVQLSEDRETYFGIEDNQKAELAKTTDIDLRRQIIYKAQQARKAMLNSNPYLKAEIMGNIDNQGELEVKFRELSEIVSSKNSPLDKRSRAAMQLVVSEMGQFLNIAQDQNMASRYDFSEVKAAKKKSINKIIEEYSKTYPEVREANRLIFRSLLNSYSKDVTTARAQEE